MIKLYNIIKEIIQEDIEGLDNAKEKLSSIYKLVNVEDFTDQRRGYKNYIKVEYIPKTSPQTQEVSWVKIPYSTPNQIDIIYKELNLPK